MKTIEQWNEILKDLKRQRTNCDKRYLRARNNWLAIRYKDAPACKTCGHSERTWTEVSDLDTWPETIKLHKERDELDRLGDLMWQIKDWLNVLRDYATGEPELDL
ncbi:MAG: hypothetical protein ACW99J_20855 [Candidatus Thorarchaeota archaeon]|jgi:hypothetical protein